MHITKETTGRICALSHLRLTEQENERLTAELEKIVAYFDILSQLPTGDVEPAGHIPPVSNVLRGDEALPSQVRGQLLANAPAHDGEAFLVPRAVE